MGYISHKKLINNFMQPSIIKQTMSRNYNNSYNNRDSRDSRPYTGGGDRGQPREGGYRNNARSKYGTPENIQRPPLPENVQFDYASIQTELVDKNNIMASPIVFEQEQKKFDDIGGEKGLKENLLRGIYSFGYDQPSDIQGLAIPQIIAGKNILAQSQSGTGKTGAFIISALEVIDENIHKPQCIIISPTAELAQQTYIVGMSISEFMGINFSYSVGGTSRMENISELTAKDGRAPQVIIATPGRLLDLVTSQSQYFTNIKLLIIDECDELMSGTFQMDISRIIHQLPENKQICLFSATLTVDIIRIAEILIPNHVKILVKKENVTLEGITQTYVEIHNPDEKINVLIGMLGSLQLQQLIIYVNNKKTAQYIQERLQKNDFEALTISSDNDKFRRAEIIREFKKGEIKCLISTDLLSRGIDIQQLSLVINYDMPKPDNIQCYVHRIGRSGRFGKKGLSINLVTDRDRQVQNLIEMTFGCQIKPLTNDFQKYL